MMKPKSYIQYIKTVILLLLVGTSFQLNAQDTFTINNYSINFKKTDQSFTNLIAKASLRNPIQVYAILNIDPNENQLSSIGIIKGDYLGNNIYSLKFTQSLKIEQINKLITAWAAVQPDLKIANYFNNTNNTQERIFISLFKDTDTSLLRQSMVAANGIWDAEQKWKLQNKWVATVEKSKMNLFATDPNIIFISPKFDDQSLEDPAISISNASSVLSVSNGLGLSGEGVVLGIGDDSYPNHIDYNDRVNNLNPILQTQHGVFTTGIMAGAGIVNEKIRGMAPKANIVSNFFSNIIAFGREYEDNFNMKLSNNSYAAIVGNCNYAGTYDVVSQFVDELAIDRPELLNIFAAGNDGYMTCSPYPQRYGTVVGSYQAAKNALVVGLIGKNSNLVNNNGSKGPVKDGRLKPEMVAVGHQNTSTTFNNVYTSGSGTSYACPNVAGAAGLLQQRFKQKFGGNYPSSALLKAILMNSADDLGTPGPDYANGFGNLNVGEAVNIIDNTQFFSSSISHLGSKSHIINTPANLGQLKVMVYWNDVPVSPASTKALVNDIDMTISGPGNTTSFPLVLNSDPAHILDAAIPGVDHLNNVEQIVINAPQAGVYTVNLSGFNIPEGPQDYVVVYSFINNDINIVYPTANVSIEPNVATDIHWQVLGNNDPFVVELSTDNGASWTSIATVPADKRFATLTAPNNTASNQCKVRVSRAGQNTISETFNIIERPVITLASSQCPGNISINWAPITGVSKYYIYKKIGSAMEIIDSTTNTNYTYSGLSLNETYWVAVAASINGGRSYRSLALSRQPNNGNCTGITQHGDLMISEMLFPKTGRKNTSTEFTGMTTIALLIKNNDNIINNNHKIQYRLNGGTWQSYINTSSIPAANQSVANINGFNLTAVGSYEIEAVIQNMDITDPVMENDTFKTTIYHLPNNPLNLSTPYTETFETTPVLQKQKNFLGLENANRFDFENTTEDGRLRTHVQNEITIDGTRSISMDITKNYVSNPSASSLNSLLGTYNLSNYNVATDEIRLEFDYRLHGISAFYNENRVYVRGSDQEAWIPLANFDTNNIGSIEKYGSISLRDALTNNGQNFSSSTQIKITQRDVSLIGGVDFGAGLTVDNISLFKAENDIALISANNIKKFNCALGNNVPLSVEVANNMIQAHNNIPIFYQIGNQPIVSEIIPSIAAKDTITYNFSHLMDLSQNGHHTINVWVNFPGDNYSFNDTLRSIELHNQPVINTFPYLEGFEQNDGYYFSEGKNNSWDYGIPNGGSLNHAANGKKIWKTSLSGAYNSYESSILYSPCFDNTALNDPMLSFSFFFEMEDPNGADVYDSAYMEYSVDGGLNWTLLGAYQQGYNWYNHENNSWTGTDHNYWHVASIPLPKSTNLALRWVIQTDPGANFAGLAIDDIHIFDYQKPIFDADSFSPAPTNTISGITSFENNGNISGIINPLSQSLGTLSFQSYKHDNYISPDSQQFYLPRNFAISPSSSIQSPVELRFFVKDSMMAVVREATNCLSCNSHPKEVYQLGVTTYIDANSNVINNKLEDDINGMFTYLHKDSVQWIPYYDGYYAIFNTNNIGEYWFNDGGITHSNPLPLNALNFTAQKGAEKTVKLSWLNRLDEKVEHYQLQSDFGLGFQEVVKLNSINDSNHQYHYIDTAILLHQPFVLYRLKYTFIDGRIFYGPIRKISWDNLPTSFEIFPNPTYDGIINLKWYNNNEESFKWGLYSILGQEIASGEIDQNKFSGVEQISFKDKGHIGEVYILKIKFKNHEQKYKILYLQN
ncbi:MAG TPA: S8 family serine peptidase [Edaphocola sp.]|nr:S8 family serine peptidase [Edaphocola sp.]